MKPSSKVKSLAGLQKIVDKLKRQGKRIVFTNGCFDLIHPGHIKVLNLAKSKGEILILGLNSDVSVRKIKGNRRPLLNEKARAALLGAIEVIDYIVLFDEPTPLRVIKTLKPEVLVKGGDWVKGKIVGSRQVKQVIQVKLQKGYSTSNIINKILRLYGKK